jgi:hypothetical protein
MELQMKNLNLIELVEFAELCRRLHLNVLIRVEGKLSDDFSTIYISSGSKPAFKVRRSDGVDDMFYAEKVDGKWRGIRDMPPYDWDELDSLERKYIIERLEQEQVRKIPAITEDSK